MPHRLRNTFLRFGTATAIAAALVVPVMADDHDHAHASSQVAPDAKRSDAAASVSPDDAIKMLADGNARFVAGTPSGTHLDQARLCETFAGGQHPYAAVLSCADSRVPVEHVLDAGIGDLFVVRVAGNVADVDEIGTLEYGVEHLGINAILVLGHTKCGAVTAVVDGSHLTKNIEKLVDNIVPAAEDARKAFPQLSGPRLVTQAIRFNVRRSIADLVANSDVIRERVKDGRLKIVGGVYDLHTGEVDWFEQSASTVATSTTSVASPRGASAHAAGRHDADEPGHAKSTSNESSGPSSAHGEAKSKGESKHAEHAERTERAEHAEHAESSEGSDRPAHKTASAEKSADAHGKDAEKKLDDEHAKTEHGEASPAASATPPARKENLPLLGGMLAASSVLSFGMIQLFSKRSSPAAPAPAPAPAAPAAAPSPATPAAAAPASAH